METGNVAFVVLIVAVLSFVIGLRWEEEPPVVYKVDTTAFDSVMVLLEDSRKKELSYYNEILEHEKDYIHSIDSVISVIYRERPSFASVQSRGMDTGRYSVRNVIADFYSAIDRHRVGDTLYWSARRLEIRDSLSRITD